MLRKIWDERPGRYCNTHQHVFEDNMSEAERQEWLNQVEARLTEFAAVPVEIEYRDTGNGFEFSFENSEHYALFMLTTFGDMEGHRNHTHSHEFSDGIDTQWVSAARQYLDAMGIDYDLEEKGNTVHFKFDRLSERLAFNALIEGGQIDRLAEFGIDEEFHAQVRQYREGFRPYVDNVLADGPTT